jgi:sporulation-control protein spo0M
MSASDAIRQIKAGDFKVADVATIPYKMEMEVPMAAMHMTVSSGDVPYYVGSDSKIRSAVSQARRDVIKSIAEESIDPGATL